MLICKKKEKKKTKTKQNKTSGNDDVANDVA